MRIRRASTNVGKMQRWTAFRLSLHPCGGSGEHRYGSIHAGSSRTFVQAREYPLPAVTYSKLLKVLFFQQNLKHEGIHLDPSSASIFGRSRECKWLAGCLGKTARAETRYVDPKIISSILRGFCGMACARSKDTLQMGRPSAAAPRMGVSLQLTSSTHQSAPVDCGSGEALERDGRFQ